MLTVAPLSRVPHTHTHTYTDTPQCVCVWVRVGVYAAAMNVVARR